MFLCFGPMVLIPGYPYYIMCFYGCLGLFFAFVQMRETNDALFTAMLPVSKRQAVYAKCAFCAAIQLGQLVLSVPFAWMRPWLIPMGNPVGIEANVAFYGFALMLLALFNGIFLPVFYRDAYSAGKAFLLAGVAMGAGIVLLEALIHLPGLAWLDSIQGSALLQLPVLLAGAVVYTLGIVSAARCAASRYEQVDL